MNSKRNLGTKIAAGAIGMLAMGGAVGLTGTAFADEPPPTARSQIGDYTVRTTMKFHALKGYLVELTPSSIPTSVRRTTRRASRC